MCNLVIDIVDRHPISKSMIGSKMMEKVMERLESNPKF